MGFFDKFKLVKQKSGYVVRYCDKTFITIRPEILKHIIKDHVSKKFVTELAGFVKPQDVSKKINISAKRLLSLYNKSRKKYFKNKNISDIKIDSKDFTYFLRASSIIKQHGTTNEVFLKSQLDGLSFINEGQGQFPKPNQLATSKAEDRLVDSLYNQSLDNDPNNRIELKKEDRETELMKNPKFVSIYNKMEKNKASLREANFVHDCMLARKGSVTSFVTDYIDELEE